MREVRSLLVPIVASSLPAFHPPFPLPPSPASLIPPPPVFSTLADILVTRRLGCGAAHRPPGLGPFQTAASTPPDDEPPAESGLSQSQAPFPWQPTGTNWPVRGPGPGLAPTWGAGRQGSPAAPVPVLCRPQSSARPPAHSSRLSRGFPRNCLRDTREAWRVPQVPQRGPSCGSGAGLRL